MRDGPFSIRPAIARIARQRSGIETFVYGDFDAGHQRWESYPATARFGTSYVGLRSRLTILTEGYSYAPYRYRVLATRDFVRASLEFIREHRAAIRGLPIPRGGFGRPEEIAAVIAFLLGPDASFCCGTILFADGGSDALLRPDGVSL